MNDSAQRMKFGIFMGPFHRVTENPTLALQRDLELVQWLDALDYDEAWIGEHHSSGWEIISSPELFIAAAAERTRKIKLGTGVISLPYHHPLMVANRMSQLDHMTRGRVLFGVGPGALASDAHMLGIDEMLKRERMDEALGIILRLFTESDPITYKSDWFELNDAMMQIKPYQTPYMPVAVSSILSPSGVALSGKHGTAVLSITVPRDPSKDEIQYSKLWKVAEESAESHGKTVRREDWRLTIPVHVAETTKQARDEIRLGSSQYLREYGEDVGGRKRAFNGPDDQLVDFMADNGFWIVGSPEDCIAGINRLTENSGGFGGLLVQTIDWASRENTKKSFELIARYVMPHFHESTKGLVTSAQWTKQNRNSFADGQTKAVEKAQEDYDSSATAS